MGYLRGVVSSVDRVPINANNTWTRPQAYYFSSPNLMQHLLIILCTIDMYKSIKSVTIAIIISTQSLTCPWFSSCQKLLEACVEDM